ncbi:uncharacterized protein PFL1_05014 [Pseudozyma flocculosa PF-1]|uniref:BHLH domain-containing protein n=2 Tax=Pseudozyma flocculosa TaxID=84751 RepID=A0A5C3EUZ6_9BASI|nr:uncharacterized protein PFL1_05014 [Pseudozyma flocculosa PF-1]EPQ27476.1 hypothetical protein PFL1_05014 [Pseudozyma flocculosa PF-1]SPO36093.1 uncharacterized protein PSFLO_01564 [Pseudozyma flocculosa]
MSFNGRPALSNGGAAPAQILMPKKRQHGFDLGPSTAVQGASASSQPSSSGFLASVADSKPLTASNSFIDTDILLSDDLWNQISAGTGHLSDFHHPDGVHDHHRSGLPHSHNGAMTPNDVSMTDDHAAQQPGHHHHAPLPHQSHHHQQPIGMPESFINIPQSQAADFFGIHAGSYQSFVSQSSHHDDHSLFGRDGAGSMEEEDSPDGSNGDTASTVATSVISPSSHGTMASSLSKSLQSGRHRRSGSSASSQAKGRTGRSISRPNLKTIAQEGSRKAERSPSQDRGGVGKAPTSRSRPSRRASIGPAAQAAVQASVHGHLRIDAQGAAVSVGAATKQEPRSPTFNLSSSSQSTQQRWSMFGGSGEVQDPTALQNLTLAEQHPYLWKQAVSQSQNGISSPASASLPTPLSFQASMQQLHLQTPPVPTPGLQSQSSMDEMPRDASAEPYNPFLFPPYAQMQEGASHGTKSEVSVPSQRAGSEASQDPSLMESVSQHGAPSSSPAQQSPSQSADADPADARKAPAASSKAVAAATARERKMSKSASQSAAKKALQDVREEAQGKGRPAADATSSGRNDDEDDEAVDDEDEEQPLANMSKSEAEAKRLAEKRRRRRESHNAVERRRRDNINEKITELATLLPEAMLLDAIATSTQGGNSGTFAPALTAKAALAAAAAAAAKGDTPPEGLLSGGQEADLTKCSTAAYAAALAPVHANSAALAAAQAKPNKGIILRKSVEYIRHLQQFLDMQMSRIGFLEAELQRHREAMQCSGTQMPSMPVQPIHDLFGFSSAFGADGSGGFFAGGAMGHDINTRSLMDLGAPPPPPPHPPQHPQQHCQEPQVLPAGPSETPHRKGGSQERPREDHVAATCLVDWLEGYDQRTGLPRRSSVDPIEEEDEHEGQERDSEQQQQRGRSRQAHGGRGDGKEGGAVEEEEERGRSRQRGNASSHSQHGSWPALEMTGARSPMQLLSDGGSKEDQLDREFTHLTDFKMEA